MYKLTQEIVTQQIFNKCINKNYILLENIIYKDSNTKIHLRCKKDNYEWFTTYNKFIYKNRGCQKCGGSVKITQQEAEEKIKQKCLEKDCRLKESFIYKNNKTTILLICNKDNYGINGEWKTRYSSFIYNKSKCSKCANVAKITQTNAEENILKKCIIKNYSLIENFIYINSKTKNIHLKCNKDNYNWYTSYENFITNNRNCSKCVNNIKVSQEEAEKNVLQICKEKNYTLVEDFIYTNAFVKIKIRCNKDNHIWEPNYKNFIKSKSNCPKCCNIPRFGQDEAEKNVLQRCKEKNYTLVKDFEYKNNKTRLYLKCDKCNYEWNTSYNQFINNKTGCIECKKSKGEIEISNYLNNKNINYIHNWNPKNLNEILNIPIKKFKSRLSYDFYLKDLNIVIEFQGRQHIESVRNFGGDDALKQQIINDNLKKKYCDICNIKIIYIYYYEFKKIITLLDEKLTII